MTNQSKFGIRRGGVLLATAAIVFAACGSGTATTPPAASTPAGSSAPVASSSAGSSAAASVTPSVPPASFDPSAIAAAKAYAATLGTNIGGSVSILAVWGGTEQAQFLGMLQPFEDATGITVNYTGTRDEPAVLTAGIASGQLPDVAGLPGPAQMVQYEQAGKLQDLSALLDVPSYTAQTPDALVKLGTTADGKLSGVFLDVSAKGQIWYDPAVTGDLSTTAPKTWDDLTALINTDKAKATAPWCFSVESGAASGLAGHRRPRVVRPQECRTRRLQQLVGRQDQVERSGDQDGVPGPGHDGFARASAARTGS